VNEKMNMLSLIIGQSPWHVSAGGVTAPTFKLVLGSKIRRARPLKNPAQPEEFQLFEGSIQILVWCSWRIQTPSSLIASSAQGEQGLIHVRSFVGVPIRDAICESPFGDLTVGFADDRTIKIFPDAVEDEENAIPNWELVVDDRQLVVGPGAKCVESTRPSRRKS